MIDTKEKILDTAERMFSENGFSGTSLRGIIAQAGVNLASVHYHFHSKEVLLEAVILRRVEPVNEARLALLDECERAAGGGRPELESVLRAFLVPTLQVAHKSARGGKTFIKLMGRLYAEGEHLPRIFRAHFSVLLKRFQDALRRALPELPEAELFWRIHFATGAMAFMLRGSEELQQMSGGLCDTEDPQEALEHLVAFISAGMRAPVMIPEKQER